MTRAIEEVLSGSASPTSATSSNSDVVYIGEDVEHGGYYLVTEGLKKKFVTFFFPTSALSRAPPPQRRLFSGSPLEFPTFLPMKLVRKALQNPVPIQFII